jgi:Protein of unknown function (DUF3027)
MVMSPTATRHPGPDQLCADAVDLARAAADEVGPGLVGQHIGMRAEGDRVLTHLFACLNTAYVGWCWAVTVTRAARSKQVTVSESLLLPGPDALVAPPWVPWTERVRPGDLKVGDLMPASEGDERLVPVSAIEGADSLLDWDESDAWSVAVGLPGSDLLSAVQAGGELRPRRVLSAVGRDDAAVRWYTGAHGPGTALAAAAPGHCLTCGFLIRLGGQLGRVFGVCANEFAPDDGKVVSVDHGCGAHSDAGRPADIGIDVPAPAVDELGYDMMTQGTPLPDSVLETLDNELL